MQESNTDTNGNNSCEETGITTEKPKKITEKENETQDIISTLIDQKLEEKLKKYISPIEEKNNQILTIVQKLSQQKNTTKVENSEENSNSKQLLGKKQKRGRKPKQQSTELEITENSEVIQVENADKTKNETNSPKSKSEGAKRGRKPKNANKIDDDNSIIEEIIEDSKKSEQKSEEKLNEKLKTNEKTKTEKEDEVKFYYENQVLNNKKTKWDVEIKKAKGLVCVGIGERKKGENLSPVELNVKKSEKNSKLFYGIDNEKGTYSWENATVVEKKDVKGVPFLKEGDVLNFIYNPKFKQLKISKNKFCYLIENLEYKNDDYLVPCAQLGDKDKVYFKNFEVLADYSK